MDSDLAAMQVIYELLGESAFDPPLPSLPPPPPPPGPVPFALPQTFAGPFAGSSCWPNRGLALPVLQQQIPLMIAVNEPQPGPLNYQPVSLTQERVSVPPGINMLPYTGYRFTFLRTLHLLTEQRETAEVRVTESTVVTDVQEERGGKDERVRTKDCQTNQETLRLEFPEEKPAVPPFLSDLTERTYLVNDSTIDTYRRPDWTVKTLPGTTASCHVFDGEEPTFTNSTVQTPDRPHSPASSYPLICGFDDISDLLQTWVS